MSFRWREKERQEEWDWSSSKALRRLSFLDGMDSIWVEIDSIVTIAKKKRKGEKEKPRID